MLKHVFCDLKLISIVFDFLESSLFRLNFPHLRLVSLMMQFQRGERKAS